MQIELLLGWDVPKGNISTSSFGRQDYYVDILLPALIKGQLSFIIN